LNNLGLKRAFFIFESLKRSNHSSSEFVLFVSRKFKVFTVKKYRWCKNYIKNGGYKLRQRYKVKLLLLTRKRKFCVVSNSLTMWGDVVTFRVNQLSIAGEARKTGCIIKNWIARNLIIWQKIFFFHFQGPISQFLSSVLKNLCA